MSYDEQQEFIAERLKRVLAVDDRCRNWSEPVFDSFRHGIFHIIINEETWLAISVHVDEVDQNDDEQLLELLLARAEKEETGMNDELLFDALRDCIRKANECDWRFIIGDAKRSASQPSVFEMKVRPTDIFDPGFDTSRCRIAINRIEISNNNLAAVTRILCGRAADVLGIRLEEPFVACKIDATFDNVVLKVMKKERKKGMIALPESQSDESDFCEVVSVGPDAEKYFKVGQLVLRPDPAEYEWADEDDNDQVYLICSCTSIAAVKHGDTQEQVED